MSSEKEQPVVAVDEVYSRAEKYVEENKASLLIIVGVIVLVIGGYVAWRKMIIEPRELNAQEEIWKAERYLEADDFEHALNGDGSSYGFLDIMEEFGMTESASLSQYYAGICYYRKGEQLLRTASDHQSSGRTDSAQIVRDEARSLFESAVEYLKKFDTDDEMVGPVALGLTGDSYAELGELEESVSFYLEAADKGNNEFITPVYLKKAALVYEEMGKYDKAVSIYEQIRTEYSKTNEASDIDKYIVRARTLSGK